MRKLLCVLLLLAVAVTAFAAGGQNQNAGAPNLPPGVPQRPAGYAAKPITFIVPFAPGGAQDNAVRAFQPILAKWGVELIITNVPGGGGSTGTLQGVTSPADGYTLTIASSGFFTTWSTGAFDFSLDQCTVITRTISDPLGIFVRADAPWKDAQELVDYWIAHPGEFMVGGASAVPTPLTLLTGALKDRLGGKDAFNLLGFEGTSRVATEILGGHIQGALGKFSDFIMHVNSGTMRPIMYMSASRNPLNPDVKTFSELPYPAMFPFGDPICNTTYVVGPAGLRPEVANYLRDLFIAAVDSPEYQEFAKNSGSLAVPTRTPEESRAEAQKSYEAKLEESRYSGLI